MGGFNKNRLMQFAEYKDSFKMTICLAGGKIFERSYLGELVVATKDKIRIGIDQSSTQTGVAVKKSTGELLCLIDFVNESRLPFNIYRDMLGLKIEQTFNDCEVEMCVLEKMWGGNKNSFDMLTALSKFIGEYKFILPGWRNAEVADILPNVWRSSYLVDAKYKGQFTKDKVKVAAMNEGVERYPWLKEYGYSNANRGHVNDSFDALGILEGYEDKTFSDDGCIRRVSNTIKATNHKYSYVIFQTDNFEDLIKLVEDSCPPRSVEEYEYNTEFSFYENVHKATSVTNKLVAFLVNDDIAKIQLMWKYRCLLARDKGIYLVGWRNTISEQLGNY